MKRNQFGINLDEGIPLAAPEEFDLLYVPCFEESRDKLLSWMHEASRPILFGGQIGSGKSTLIRKIFLDSGLRPDIVMQFDRDGLNLDSGDFIAILLEGFIKHALKHRIDMSFCNLPKEIADLPENDWQGLLNRFAPKSFSIDTFNSMQALRKKIGANADYVQTVVREIGRLLREKKEKQFWIFASGVDKFASDSPAFLMLQGALTELFDFKTLFEANSVHLFSLNNGGWGKIDRFLLPAAPIQACEQMLTKRMGIYAYPLRKELSILAQWSGGNPRQAIRLLEHFETSRKRHGMTKSEKLALAVRETTRDFFAFSEKPSNQLMTVLQKDRKLENAIVTLPGDKDTARRAIYGNWILITGQAEGASWPAIINPLVKPNFSKEPMPQEPEIQMLKEYEASLGISANGIRINKLQTETGEEKSGDQLFWEFLEAGVERPIKMNLSEILDVMGSALLSTDRADRVIIAYRDSQVLEAARAYLFVQANAYENQKSKHIKIVDQDSNALIQLQEVLNLDADIISIDFVHDLSDQVLDAIDKLRDQLISYQMIWWIPLEAISRYLSHWTQLRQLFEIFVLEDEFLKSLTIEEIQDDLEFYKDQFENEDEKRVTLMNYLSIILDYLSRNQGGAENG